MRANLAIATLLLNLSLSNCSDRDTPFSPGDDFSIATQEEVKLEKNNRKKSDEKEEKDDKNSKKESKENEDSEPKKNEGEELPQEVSPPTCPDGMVDEQGTCFGLGSFDESCSNVCGFYNLPYDIQTVNLIGSQGNKALCRKVANALGIADSYAQEESALRDIAEFKESLYWGTEDDDLEVASSFFLRPTNCHINEKLKSLYPNEPGVSSIRWRSNPSVDFDFYDPDDHDFAPVADPTLTDATGSAPDVKRICGCTKI